MLTVLSTIRKGGAGKSSLATNLAAIWAQGQPTLLIDLDTQGDASTWLDVQGTGEALADALAGRGGLDRAICTTGCGVDVAVGGEALGYVAETVRPDAVSRAIASVRDRGYRVVVIDCPPSLSRIVLAAWRSSPGAIPLVPVDGPGALRGVSHLGDAWEDAGLEVSRLRPVVTRQDRRRVLDRAIDEQARALFPRVLTSVIRESVVVAESAARRQPLITYAPRHAVTEDFRRLAREVARG
jgi:chromosome partitioning protein